MQCPGLFRGELIIGMEHKSQAIIIAIQATNTDLGIISKVFEDLISSKFNQCMLLRSPRYFF